MHKTKSYCIVNSFVWEMWNADQFLEGITLQKKGCFWQPTVQERIFNSEKKPAMLHSLLCLQKQRIINGAFSFCHDAKGADLTLWCSVLKRSAKQKNVGKSSANILERPCANIQAILGKRSKFDLRWFQLHLVLLLSLFLICGSIFLKLSL